MCALAIKASTLFRILFTLCEWTEVLGFFEGRTNAVLSYFAHHICSNSTGCLFVEAPKTSLTLGSTHRSNHVVSTCVCHRKHVSFFEQTKNCACFFCCHCDKTLDEVCVCHTHITIRCEATQKNRGMVQDQLCL